ncbi:MAG: hypothetical protein HUJ65_00310, partial [Oscillospiraceae bacterium]|nr:hypothetical protein [Oscillospiraceae bacterium]
PTSSLDPENADAVIKLLKRIAQDGTSVLMSTHDREYICAADAVYTMNRGRLKECGDMRYE